MKKLILSLLVLPFISLGQINAAPLHAYYCFNALDTANTVVNAFDGFLNSPKSEGMSTHRLYAFPLNGENTITHCIVAENSSPEQFEKNNNIVNNSDEGQALLTLLNQNVEWVLDGAGTPILSAGNQDQNAPVGILIDIRAKEAQISGELLGVVFRENMNFKDAFIFNDETHQRKLISVIRRYRPEIVLCNAVKDRHIDHAKASELVSHSCFLSGLQKIKTFDDNGQNQEAFRPKHIFHYIQWEDLAPDFIINITGHLDKKMKAIRIFKSQFYNSKSEEPQTPISSLNFIESVESLSLIHI